MHIVRDVRFNKLNGQLANLLVHVIEQFTATIFINKGLITLGNEEKYVLATLCAMKSPSNITHRNLPYGSGNIGYEFRRGRECLCALVYMFGYE